MLMVPKIALTSRSSLASIGTNSRSSGKETNKKERRKKTIAGGTTEIAMLTSMFSVRKLDGCWDIGGDHQETN